MLPMQLEPVAAVLPPAIAAIVVCLLLARTRRGRAHGAPITAGWEGIAVAAGLALAIGLLRGWPGFPPANVHSWPLFIACAAILPAAVAEARLGWLLTLSSLLIVAALPMLLTVPLRTWNMQQAAMWFAVFGISWIAIILASRSTAARLPLATMPAWAGALAVTGYIIADPVTAKHHGFILVGAGVAAGIVGLARLRWGDRIRVTPVAIAIAAIIPALLLLAHVMTDNLPAIGLLPLVAAPFAPWLLWPLRHHPRTVAIASFVLSAAVAAVALALVHAPEPSPVGW